ncbi:MAG: hypothetical protein ACE5PV_27055 [Candidatus Poribacteria bacterium]
MKILGLSSPENRSVSTSTYGDAYIVGRDSVSPAKRQASVNEVNTSRR